MLPNGPDWPSCLGGSLKSHLGISIFLIFLWFSHQADMKKGIQNLFKLFLLFQGLRFPLWIITQKFINFSKVALPIRIKVVFSSTIQKWKKKLGKLKTCKVLENKTLKKCNVFICTYRISLYCFPSFILFPPLNTLHPFESFYKLVSSPPLNSFPPFRSSVKLVSAETIQGNTVSEHSYTCHHFWHSSRSKPQIRHCAIPLRKRLWDGIFPTTSGEATSGRKYDFPTSHERHIPIPHLWLSSCDGRLIPTTHGRKYPVP